MIPTQFGLPDPNDGILVMHIGTNNQLYSFNMNNATLKTVDVERDLGVIINKNGKYSEQCLMAAKKRIVF